MNASDRLTVFGNIAELKLARYQDLVILHALIEILREKGLVSLEELVLKSQALDSQDTALLGIPDALFENLPKPASSYWDPSTRQPGDK